MPTKNDIKFQNKQTLEETQEIQRKIEDRIEEQIKLLSEKRGTTVYPLFLTRSNINSEAVDDIFEDLRTKFMLCEKNECEKLDVILESAGGSIDSAYNIALLIRRYAKKELNFIIPRWAKSAATVIACSGDKILMTPIAELGPVDPQITMLNPLDKRFEEFSPLHIDSTLALIREEFQQGQPELAQGLLERLQFPLTLGGFKKSLEIGMHYIERLLSSRMLKKNPQKAKEIAYQLVHGYVTHAFCIEIDEAKSLGLKAELLPSEETTIVWELRKLLQQRDDIEKLKKQEMMKELLKQIPPELMKELSPDFMKNKQNIEQNNQDIQEEGNNVNNN